MKRTRIGDYLKMLRIANNGILLKDMADALGVTSSFLSAVEVGKKKFPNEWYEVLKKEYKLSEEEMKDMKEAVAETNKSIELSFDDASLFTQKLAVSFARNIDYVDEETAEKVCKLLEKKRKEV